MKIRTTRFGPLDLEPEDVLRFPQGLLGFESCQDWVLLADAENSALGWLQSTTRPDVALAVVSPRRFVPENQLRVDRSELAPLALGKPDDGQVLLVVAKHGSRITLNLKAPIVVHLARRVGRQVVANGELPLQYELQAAPVRKSA
jgi:flagellar assembly factor FliW